MAQRKNQTMLNGALILAVSTMLVKVISAFYKMPLTDLIGAVGRGYFTSAYTIYTPIYAIAMAGLPVAVARLVSQSAAMGRYRDARAIFKVALRIFFLAGIVGFAVLLIIAYPYTVIADARESIVAVFAIAPAIFFCCMMSAYRGYYEGLRNMIPTSVSQIIEAIAKLALGLALAYAVLKIGIGQFEAGSAAVAEAAAKGLAEIPAIKVFGGEVTTLAEAYGRIYPYSAAGAILGVTFGTVFGLIYLVISHKLKGDGITREQLVNSPPPIESKLITRRLISIAIPIVASTLILNVTNIIDTITVQNRIASVVTNHLDIIKEMYGESLSMAQILDSDIKDYLWGTYGAVLDFRNLIPTIVMSLGVSALPALSEAWTLKDRKNIKITVESVLRVTMMIALPAGIGMALLAEPILLLIYGKNNPDMAPIAAPIMATYGYATALMAVSTPITNMLQGIGRLDVPVKSMIAGAVVKLVGNYFLVGNPSININGAAFSSILCYIVIVAINLYYLIKETHFKINIMSVFVKPLIASAGAGAAAWGGYKLFYKIAESALPADSTSRLLDPNTISTLGAVAAAVIVYAVILLFIRGISKDDVNMLPKGEKIAKVLEKHRLLG